MARELSDSELDALVACGDRLLVERQSPAEVKHLEAMLEAVTSKLAGRRTIIRINVLAWGTDGVPSKWEVVQTLPPLP